MQGSFVVMVRARSPDVEPQMVEHVITAATFLMQGCLRSLPHHVFHTWSMSPRQGYGDRRPYAVPASLAELTGPVSGVVRLPASVAWTGRRDYDLDSPADLIVMYERVIVEAPSALTLHELLEQGHLFAVWAKLFLPAPVRRLWQSHFPQLASAA